MKSQAPTRIKTESASAQIVAVTASSLPDQPQALARARAFAEPLIASETLDTGENTLVHADAVAAILKSIGGSEAMQAASYLVYACKHLTKPLELITKAFGAHYAELALETTKLVQVQEQARAAKAAAQLENDPKAQLETVRKMLLAFSRDLRVVMLRLASRLQTLRYWLIDWASGKSNGKWKTWLFVFWNPKPTKKLHNCWMKNAWSASSSWKVCARSWSVG